MNLTYLAVTGGIVLATILVYALLSWGRAPAQEKPAEPAPLEPESAPAEPPPKRNRRSAGTPAPALAAKGPPGKPRHDPS